MISATQSPYTDTHIRTPTHPKQSQHVHTHVLYAAYIHTHIRIYIHTTHTQHIHTNIVRISTPTYSMLTSQTMYASTETKSMRASRPEPSSRHYASIEYASIEYASIEYASIKIRTIIQAPRPERGQVEAEC